MFVNTILEIYTTFAGWIFANVLTQIILYGIFLIPFAFAVIMNFRNAITTGSFRSTVELGVKNLEADIYEMLLVFMLVFVPVLPLELNTLQYDTPDTDFLSVTMPDVITTVNDPTTYATTLNPSVEDFQTEFGAPKVPVITYFVLKVAYGANYALSKAMINSNARNDLAAAEVAIGTFGFDDPVLGSELMQFNADCFRRARSKFVTFSSNGTLNNLLTNQGRAALEEDPTDINRLGSMVFQTTPGLYAICNNPAQCQRTLRAMQPMEGWPYNQARDGIRLPEQEGLPGQPYCDEWWRDLRARIINSSPEAQTVFQKVKTTFGFNFGANEQDVLANQIIYNSFTNDTTDKPITMVGLSAGRDWEIGEELRGMLTNVGLKWSTFTEGLKTPAIKNAMYIILALALMLAYTYSPVILLFTGFKLKGVIIVSGIIVTLVMANSVITMVEFMEVSIYSAIFEKNNGLWAAIQGSEQTLFELILKISYPIVLLIYFTIMSLMVNQVAGFSAATSAGRAAAPTKPQLPRLK